MEWLRAAQLFVNVVQGGSMSSAGRQFGLSPASVSRHIGALEETVGGRLLNRTSRKLTLTEAGELYYREVEQILHQIAEANQRVAILQSGPRGVLRVHSRMLVGQLHIVPALPDFLAAYPEIRMDLLLSNDPIDLVAQNVDVDIRVGKMVDSALVARKLASAERIVCATPGYLSGRPEVTKPADVQLHNCLIYRRNLAQPRWRFVCPDGHNEEIPVTSNFAVNNGLALLTAVRAGFGLALMPDWAIREDLAAGRLKRVLPGYLASHMQEFDNGIYAVFQPSRQRSAKLRAFLDYMADHFKRKAAGWDAAAATAPTPPPAAPAPRAARRRSPTPAS